MRVCADDRDDATPLITQGGYKVQFPLARQPTSHGKDMIVSIRSYLSTHGVTGWSCVGCVRPAVEWPWWCHHWVWSPSVGWDVMVDLRRTQKSKSLLVFPLFSHLRKEKKYMHLLCPNSVWHFFFFKFKQARNTVSMLSRGNQGITLISLTYLQRYRHHKWGPLVPQALHYRWTGSDSEQLNLQITPFQRHDKINCWGQQSSYWEKSCGKKL